MKKNYLLLLIAIVLISKTVWSQNFPTVQGTTTIYTPKGSSVIGTIYYQLSSGDYSSSVNYMNTFYPNAISVENPTSEYNCHGFAFHLSEGNTNKVWILNTGSNLSTYWTDGSFIEVCSESDADKAYYYAGDHSALTTSSVSGWYESKWGANRRVIHDPTDCPYDVGQYRRQYYASTKISGDIINALCTGTRVFSVKNISGATYSWTTSSNLTNTSSTNTNQLTVQRTDTINAPAWVEVEITTGCSAAVTRRLNFNVGIQIPSGIEGNDMCANTAGTVFSIPPVLDATNYQWAIYPNPQNFYINGNGGSYIDVSNSAAPGAYSLTVTISTPCGTTGAEYGFYVSNCFARGSMDNFVIYPNPASKELTVSYRKELVPDQKTQINGVKYITELRLINEGGRVLKSINNQNKNELVTMDVGDFQNGYYFLHIYEGKNVTKRQVIIKH